MSEEQAPASTGVAPLVVIVVLNWNKWKLTLDCLHSLSALAYQNYRILLIDNGSTDDSLAHFENLPKQVALVTNTDNLGYTGGNNTAMASALAEGADYVWLVNNDAVVAPDSLSLLVAAAERDPGLGMISPLLKGYEGDAEFNPAGLLVHLDRPALEVTTDTETARRWQETMPDRFALAGTALLVRRALIERTGGFDDRLFAYDEDIDLSIRCVQAGFRSAVVFAATVYHHPRPVSAADNRVVAPHVYYFMTRNDILLWRKHCTRGRAWKAALWVLHRRLGHIRDWRLRGRHDDVVEAMLSGLWDGWRGVGGRYDPSRRMPAPLRSLLLASPGFWIGLLDTLSAIGGKRAKPTLR
jgi:GT2 family glycosyltransferase